jgi:RNA polymerase sigma-70 factor (ECF subfamily)
MAAPFAGDDDRTTAAIQRYLDDLAGVKGDSPAEPIVRDLMARAAHRLHLLCGTLLYRSYPRLTRPPLNLQSDEMLSAVVERLLKAMRGARPQNVRQFFALANMHMRWELNDLARRLDERTPAVELHDAVAKPPPDPPDSASSTVGTNTRRILAAIDQLPDDEREAFSLVRIQGMAQTEVADLLGVSTKTVQRRLNRSLLLLMEKLGDLMPEEEPPAAS